MRKCKVLHVIGGLSIGGAETMVMNFWRFIDKEKFKFDFLVFGDNVGEFEKEAKCLGANIIHIEEPSKGYMQFLRNLRNVFIDHGPYDIVHSHTLLNSGFVLKVAKESCINRRIVHSHSTRNRVQENLLTRVYEILMKSLISKYATDYIACGDKAGEYLYGKRKFHDIGIVLNNSIETDRFQFNPETRDKTRVNLGVNDKLVIGNIGRFHPVKNLNFLIDVFSSVNLLVNNSVLLLVGDGMEKSNIIEKVKKYGLSDKVIFLGMRTDIPEIMQAIDVFVMTSFFEGLPVVLVEAQAASLPCVVSERITKELNLTSFVSYVDLNKSPDYWAKEILTVAKTNRCSSTKKRIEESGFDIHTEIKKLEKLYSCEVTNG